MLKTLQVTAVRSVALSRCLLIRNMSDHMDRTADSFRQQGLSEAEVVSITDASDTVRLLTLKVADPTFSFKAGQWVDFFIPSMEAFTGFSMWSAPSQLTSDRTLGLAVQLTDYPPTMVDTFLPNVRTVGGYSMYSGPRDLHQKALMGLAVKYSTHPPAHWVHKQCNVGSKVHLRVGGDRLIFDPQPCDPSWNVLHIAGGIGINPLMSMLNHTSDLHKLRRDNSDGYTPGKVELLFSASCKKELIFKTEIEDLVSRHSPNIAAKFFVTKESTDDLELSRKRIDEAEIKAALDRLGYGSKPLRCYLCGPPPMIADMEAILKRLGIKDSDVFCEKWW